MTQLRKQMIVAMQLRGYSPNTIDNYVRHVSNFAKFYNKSPEFLNENNILNYLHYCITEMHLKLRLCKFYSLKFKIFLY